jgi:GTP-binding protein required for 40S ribosome biogenesis
MPKKQKDLSDSESEISDIEDNDERQETLLDKVKQADKQAKPHEQKEVIEPETDETEEEPPYVIVVQGPKKSGKTTLIKSLVKHYTRHKIQQVSGTITLRTAKHRRITLIECPNDINGMIDLAKVADMCLVLVDASVGFEMQTFEFLSILQVSSLKMLNNILRVMVFLM